MTSTINFFQLSELPAPTVSGPATEMVVVEGNPAFRTWELERDEVGNISSGVWEATPGSWKSRRNGDWEFATILSGVVVLDEIDGESRVLRAVTLLSCDQIFTEHGKSLRQCGNSGSFGADTVTGARLHRSFWRAGFVLNDRCSKAWFEGSSRSMVKNRNNVVPRQRFLKNARGAR